MQFGVHVIDCAQPNPAAWRQMSSAESKDSRDGKERAPFFELYDLRVEVIAPPGAPLLCGARPGDWFELRGEMLYLPPDQGFSIYSLAALLLLLPAKQRVLDPYDWMYSDSDVACPDPNCPSTFRITRLGKRRFERSATTATPVPTLLK
jgi:uncharacterized repeat protein (TIGR04076 family)